MMTIFGPGEGGKLLDLMLAALEVTRRLGELPESLVREVGPKLVLYRLVCWSDYSDVCMEVMRMKLDGFVAAGTFVEVIDIPEGCNIGDITWLYEWKGNWHGMVDKANAFMAYMRYSQM